LTTAPATGLSSGTQLLSPTLHFLYEQADSLASAIAYFEFRNRKTRRLPALVLLDYDMGNHTGVDFLHWLRFVKKMTSLPVVMLSGSEGDRHVAECYAAGANYFLSKPRKFEHLKLIVQSLHTTLFFTNEPSPILLLNEYRSGPHSDHCLSRGRPSRPVGSCG
jgi:CheY-like chemotaxis protein